MNKQHGRRPFEIFTIDGLYSDDELDAWRHRVEQADPRTRPFNILTEFKNGKEKDANLSRLMFERVRPFLPDVYVDDQGCAWTFDGAPHYVMFAEVRPGQRFGIHTDTGCVYEDDGRTVSKFTLLTYLNDDFGGGATRFYSADADRFRLIAEVLPVKGRTLIFDIDVFHAGIEVSGTGNKFWIGTELVAKRQ